VFTSVTADSQLRGRWIGRGGPTKRLSTSLDLILCDFFLWDWVKEEALRSKPRTSDEMEQQL
jgi:hypothetical protein